ncbi:MAG: DUF3109 family protein [Porphyromonadaceae bacterium]|nr:DUF3109 family protein [Porphyromonadaceae bacterium]
MVQIDDTIISFDLFEDKFICDLISCKGICCVEGDAGAPLEGDEVQRLEEIVPVVWDDLPKTSQKVIKKKGVFYVDDDGEPVTSIVDGKECVFAYQEKSGIWKCSIEKAYREGKTDFQKPISCHLYPARVQKYENLTAVNVHKWGICDCARANGKNLNVRVYKFLKEPLVRKFGKEWYEQLEIAAEELKKND